MIHAKRHHPPHILKDDSIYFITSRTVDRQRHFNTDAKKKILKNCLQIALKKFNVNVFAWVILDNHYHLLVKILDSKQLPEFIRILNGKSAFGLNGKEGQRGRKIWYNYWDRCIRSERDFWIRFNYIHNNPIKHGYVKSPDYLWEYKFSSYNQWVIKKGGEWLSSCFARYPIVDFSLEEDI